MNEQRFLERIGPLFFRTDRKAISAGTSYKMLPEWSLPLAVSLLLCIEEEYDIRLGREDLAQTDTLQELFDRIRLRLTPGGRAYGVCC